LATPEGPPPSYPDTVETAELALKVASMGLGSEWTQQGSRREPFPARKAWGCPWPHSSSLRRVRVLLSVQVGADGVATAVDVLGADDPTFVEAARLCAMEELYLPALDDHGVARPGTTPPFSILFKR
jgi:hypothetical protein